MFKKLCSTIFLSLVSISNFLSAEIEYEIHDIGTLQTKASQAIALNNNGQILGWYNIDGSNTGKQFFVRNKDGRFHEIKEDAEIVYLNIPQQFRSVRIDWQYLTDDGKAYGTFKINNQLSILFMWNQKNGLVKLGTLPGNEISAINNAGQVLIKSVEDNENGKAIRRPVIWHNGRVTKLEGSHGDLGIESEESYGFDLNNNGEVVGQSLVSLSYKNEIYKQVHAVKWTNGQVIDLQKMLPKMDSSSAIAINDHSDVLIKNSEDGTLYYVEKNGGFRKTANYLIKINNIGYVYCESEVVDRENKFVTATPFLNPRIKQNNNSIWSRIIHFNKINDHGEIIAKAKTIYGEEHAMFLSPSKSK